MEVSWLAPQQDLQKSYLEEILVHLRQISIWDSPNEMLSFMQEILAIIYVNDQPEVDIKLSRVFFCSNYKFVIFSGPA